MPRLNRRSKVISIRLSDEEFDQMQSLCMAKGINSFSELARAAMRRLALQDSRPDEPEIESRFSEIQNRMGVLDREIERISSLMGLARLDA